MSVTVRTVYLQVNVTVATPLAGKAYSDLISVTVILLLSDAHFSFALVTAISRAPVIPPLAGEALAEV